MSLIQCRIASCGAVSIWDMLDPPVLATSCFILQPPCMSSTSATSNAIYSKRYTALKIKHDSNDYVAVSIQSRLFTDPHFPADLLTQQVHRK